jgi:chemotaxis protein MotB
MSEVTAKLRHIEIHEEIDSEGSWAISYGDMITLLLSFFIIFFTIEPPQKNPMNIKLKSSLVETLNGKSSAYAGEEKMEAKAEGASEDISIGKKNETGVDPSIVKEWNGLVHDKGNHVIVEFPGVSFFNSSKTEITREGHKAIQRFVSVYMPYAGNYVLSIRAFADRRSVKQEKGKRFRDNLELTALRSVSAMRILQKAGIPLSRIRVGGYGEMITTADEMSALPANMRTPASELDLARKIVLVVEPEVIP